MQDQRCMTADLAEFYRHTDKLLATQLWAAYLSDILYDMRVQKVVAAFLNQSSVKHLRSNDACVADFEIKFEYSMNLMIDWISNNDGSVRVP